MKKNKVIRSIAGSTFFKLASASVSFLSVPLLLKTLGTNDYAIWVTMTALVAWLNLFDFGSGYSLKNKVTEALAKDNLISLQPLIAGTIQFYLLMSLIILIVFLSSIFFVDIFRTHLFLSLVIYLPIIFSFPFTLGHFIIQGLKFFNRFNLILLAQSICWLFAVLAFKQGYILISIYKLAGCYSALFVISNCVILFTSLNNIQFEWKLILDFKHFQSSKTSLLIGSKFFILQVSSLFLYSLGNILTYNHLKLLNVAQYDTVNKIYLMGMTIFNVVISIFWSEISQEKALKNKIKLSKIYNQLIAISVAFTFGCIIVTLFVPQIVYIWTKHQIIVSIRELYPFLCLTSIQAFAYSGAVFLNAFEKLRGQILLSIFATIFVIPLSTFFFNKNVGIGTVPLASAILTFPTLIYVLYRARLCIKTIV